MCWSRTDGPERTLLRLLVQGRWSHEHRATCLPIDNFKRALPEGPALLKISDWKTAEVKLGQPEPCDGGEEGVVVVGGELGVQVDEEAAGHTGLALLEPEGRSFGEGQPNATD